ncbi:hypothetical protein [Roseibium suaedae]|uniref:Uncharacterized protein n=1 Tax=Roseibium suaedae TaxID=735517 RepID=A0A1M7N7Q1_9HYPH|nr:hypothetical protein [Roseibium suaedae]SHM99587.1 hypothetical protein SAMN05444272_3746 [Roseibium suaedae]
MNILKIIFALLIGLSFGVSASTQVDASDLTVGKVPVTSSGTSGSIVAQRYLPRRCRDIMDDMKDDTYALLYIASYSDLAKAFGRNPDRARRHFEEYGCDEGRSITFDGWIYVAGYSDLIRAIGLDERKALDHFLLHGAREGRSNAKFNASAYANRYNDLKAKFGNNSRKLAQHCIRYGFRERREFCG